MEGVGTKPTDLTGTWQSVLHCLEPIKKPEEFNVTEYTDQIDTSGLSCPLPILKSKKALKKLNIGDTLSIISTDAGSMKDIASWCRVTGQELLSSAEENGKYTFLVKRLK